MATRRLRRFCRYIRDGIVGTGPKLVVDMLELWEVEDEDIESATEYFCCRCRQLRLDLRKDKTRCGHCGNKDIITGPVGTLDKVSLVRKLDGGSK